MAQHCKDLNNFFIHYAMLIITILFSCFVLVHRNNLNKNIYLSKNIHFLLIHIILLLISFFIADFIFLLDLVIVMLWLDLLIIHIMEFY